MTLDRAANCILIPQTHTTSTRFEYEIVVMDKNRIAFVQPSDSSSQIEQIYFDTTNATGSTVDCTIANRVFLSSNNVSNL